MGLFSTDFDDVVPEVVVPDGRYTLQIKSAEVKTAKSGREYLLVCFDNMDVPEAQTIFHNVNAPLPEDPESTKQVFARMAKQFFDTFGQDYKDPEITGLIGCTCEANVIQETGNDGVVRNKIKRFF